MINSDFLQSIIIIISSKTGIKIRSEDQLNLQQKIDKRIKELGLKNEQDYLSLLSGSSPASTDEWHKLISQITTGESYFFRDRGQIELLRQNLLPNLLEKKQAQKTLNILSAGCSTGEEVYSLAIILGEIMPNIESWNINLVGIDLNDEAIVKAKRGIFPEWSFRGVEPHYRSVFFRHKLEGWEVIDPLKQKVRFYQCNLIEDAIPVFPIGSVDLIICRNVFIYFDPEKISLVLAKFIDLLSSGGYLLTGHTELQGQELGSLKAISFPESMVFQMATEHDENHIALMPTPSSTFLPNFKVLGQQAFNEGKYKETIGYLQNWLNLNDQDEEAMLLMAKAYANQGSHRETERLCNRVLQSDHCCVIALQLLAQIAEEQGQKEAAKEYLRRILFVDANFIPAYFDLIELHLSDREQEQARTLFVSLRNLSPALTSEYEFRRKIIEIKLENI